MFFPYPLIITPTCNVTVQFKNKHPDFIVLLSFWPRQIILIWLKLFSLSQSGGPAPTVEILQPAGTSFLFSGNGPIIMILYSQMLVEEDIFQVDATHQSEPKNSLDCDIFEGEGDPSRHKRQEEQDPQSRTLALHRTWVLTMTLRPFGRRRRRWMCSEKIAETTA